MNEKIISDVKEICNRIEEEFKYSDKVWRDRIISEIKEIFYIYE